MDRVWSVAPIATELVANLLPYSVLYLPAQHTGWSLVFPTVQRIMDYGKPVYIHVGSESRCDLLNWGDQEPKINAVKAFVLLSILGLAACLVWIYMTHTKGFKWTRFAAATAIIQALFLACGLFTFVGVSNKYYGDLDFSWSFALGWVGAVFYALAATLFWIQGNQMRAANYSNI